MSATGDAMRLHGDNLEAAGYGNTAAVARRAADEIDRLSEANGYWMNGVADAVEWLGFDREAACGPADLLPGLTVLVEMAQRAQS